VISNLQRLSKIVLYAFSVAVMAVSLSLTSSITVPTVHADGCPRCGVSGCSPCNIFGACTNDNNGTESIEGCQCDSNNVCQATP
jgi:hypothetical protein